jgi:hypothetical protein
MKKRDSALWWHGFLSGWRTKAGIVVLCIAAAAVLSGWLIERAEAQAKTNVPQELIDLALADTLDLLLINSACPKDWAEIEAAANGLFPILHPEIAQYDKPKDAAALAEEAARNWSIMNPGEEHARRMADPAYRAHVASVLVGLQFGVVQEP